MADKKIRILLVDDQRLLRDGLKILLNLEPDLQVVGESEDGAQAVEAYAILQPDVVLMDIRMPNMDGVQATREICSRWQDAAIIILTTFDDDEYVFDALRAGARGYLLKAVSAAELNDAVRKVAAGGALIEPSVARKVLAEFARQPHVPASNHLPELTERENQILQLIGLGLSNRQISERLYLAEGTVKNYVSAIFQKLGVQDRTQAALMAQKYENIKG